MSKCEKRKVKVIFIHISCSYLSKIFKISVKIKRHDINYDSWLFQVWMNRALSNAEKVWNICTSVISLMKRPSHFPAFGMHITAYVKDHNPIWCTFYLDLPFYKFSSKWIYNNENMSLIYCQLLKNSTLILKYFQNYKWG